MDVNVPLLRKTLEHITAHRSEWDQRHWAVRDDACGTAYCLAGFAVVLAGHEVDWGAGCGSFEIEGWQSGYLVGGLGIGETAAEELGIAYDPTSCECHRDEKHLFDSTNSLADLWQIANKLTEGEIEIPAEFQEG